MFNFETNAQTEANTRKLRKEYRGTIEAMMVDDAAKRVIAGESRDVVCHTVAVIVKGYNQGAKSDEVHAGVNAAIDARITEINVAEEMAKEKAKK